MRAKMRLYSGVKRTHMEVKMKVRVSRVRLDDGEHKCDGCGADKKVSRLKYEEGDSIIALYACDEHWVEAVDQLEALLSEAGLIGDVSGKVN